MADVIVCCDLKLPEEVAEALNGKALARRTTPSVIVSAIVVAEFTGPALSEDQPHEPQVAEEEPLAEVRARLTGRRE